MEQDKGMVGREHLDRGSNSADSLGAGGAKDISLVSGLINDVVGAYQDSARSLWKCAEYTWLLFERHGLYEQQFTATLCEQLAVQKDTIYHWRKAWGLRSRVGFFEGLTISHYYHAADYEDRMDDDLLKDFLEAARDSNMSVRQFAHEMDMANNDSGTLPWLRKKLKQYLGKIETLYHSSETSGLSEYKRERLQEAIKIIQDVLK